MSPSAASVAPESNGAKRLLETPLRSEEASRGSYRFKNKRMKNGHAVGSQILKTNGSTEEVLLEDVTALVKTLHLEREGRDISTPKLNLEREGKEEREADTPTLPEKFSEISVTIRQLSSTGDGLGFQDGSDSDQVYAVPFTAPGDTVTAKIFKHFEKEKYSMADFVSVTKPSPHRDQSLVKCPYFSQCSGCQFQMLPYDYQLQHKKSIVERAYKNFSNLPPALIPAVGDTIGSPLQYGYRTKLTPHFDGPPDSRRSDGRNGIKRSFTQVPPIGFMKKGTRITLDIEDCPIGTDAVRAGNKRERKRVVDNLSSYHKGATILLRENTQRIPKDQYRPAVDQDDPAVEKEDADAIDQDLGTHIHRKTCVTDPNARSTEYIDDFRFINPAGSFFQNNNSILPPFTSYIRSHILPAQPGHQIKYLIDAYSGSGLFTITLSTLFASSLGIDVSSSSIASATENATINGLTPDRARFLAADAAQLFAAITTPPAETVVMLDPPRKGCDESFLRQLLHYGPARIVYVSCNVHTQARDVGVLVAGLDGGDASYEMESLRGFDFFPQTGHVEGVAVLTRKTADTVRGETVGKGVQ